MLRLGWATLSFGAVILGALLFSLLRLPSRPAEKFDPVECKILNLQPQALILGDAESASFDLEICNRTASAIEISSVASSCTCAMLEPLPSTVPAHGSVRTRGRIRLATREFNHLLSATVSLQFRTGEGTLSRAVRALVEYRHAFEPSAVQFRLEGDEKGKTGELLLSQYSLSPNLVDPNVDAVGEFVVTPLGNWSPTTKDSHFYARRRRFHASTYGSLESGGGGELKVSDGSPAHAQRIPVVWTAGLPYRISARTLSLRPGNPGSTIRIEPTGNAPVTLVKASTPVGVRSSERQAGTSLMLELSAAEPVSKAMVRRAVFELRVGTKTFKEEFSILLFPTSEKSRFAVQNGGELP